MTTKNILCFGDSNTWGYDPELKTRFPCNKRWTGILQKLLGPHFHVIEEGLNGRTTVWDDPIEGGMGDKNGLKVLPTILSTHAPLHLVVLMLGTNDLKKRFSVNVFEIACGIERLIEVIRNHNYAPEKCVPEILLLSPPHISFLCEEFKDHFRQNTPDVSKDFHAYLHETARTNSCHYLNTGFFVEPSDIDGIHFPKESQETVAAEIKEKIINIFA